MSTRSVIGFEYASDRSVVYASCHFDGYLSHNGALLLLFHNASSRALRLAEHGSIDVLGCDSWLASEGRPSRHMPFAAVTERYDVGDTSSLTCADVERLRGEEYDYVYSEKHSMWFVRCPETGGVFKPLAPVVVAHVASWNLMLDELSELVRRGVPHEAPDF